MEKKPSTALILLVSLFFLSAKLPSSRSQQPANPVTVPAYPTSGSPSAQTCRLDLSDELFGGVGEACGRTLDRSRCCPVLAAWLFAAHARFALELNSSSPPPSASPLDPSADVLPIMPDSASQRCVASLQSSLAARDIHLQRPNATCDTVLCFCGIRLHELSSLSCPAAFSVSSASRNATPTAALKGLERNCHNASYAGCTRCLGALQKLNGRGGDEKGSSDRGTRMMKRDCQLMGLTWLLARNKTAYIPTVSAVLRAVLYSAHPQQYKCSPDQENMPLAVDALRFDRPDSSSPPSLHALFLSCYSVNVLSFLLMFHLFLLF